MANASALNILTALVRVLSFLSGMPNFGIGALQPADAAAATGMKDIPVEAQPLDSVVIGINKTALTGNLLSVVVDQDWDQFRDAFLFCF